MPKVSFIIPYYNAGATVMETLDSIWAQSFTDYDVWLVNDGSTDARSLEVLKEIEKDARVKVLHQENAGPSVARNVAIKQSQAEFIVPLDADNLIRPGSLSHLIPLMNASPDIGVMYGNLQCFGCRVGLKVQPQFDIRTQLFMNGLDLLLVIRMGVFKTAGLFDVHLSRLGLEDWEFWLRVHGSGFKFKKLDMTFGDYRVHDDSRTYLEANRNLTEIKHYVMCKHSTLYFEEYQRLYYDLKKTMELPDLKVGELILRPYRLVKRHLSKQRPST